MPVFISRDTAAMVGSIAVQWGHAENLISDLIAYMVADTDFEERFKRRRGFKDRAAIARQVLPTIVFGREDDHARSELPRLLGIAATLNWQRNIVVHGRYSFRFPPFSSIAIPTARGIHNGREVAIELSDDNLQKLWHDLCHLGGDLHRLCLRVGDVTGGPILLEDSDIIAGWPKPAD